MSLYNYTAAYHGCNVARLSLSISMYGPHGCRRMYFSRAASVQDGEKNGRPRTVTSVLHFSHEQRRHKKWRIYPPSWMFANRAALMKHIGNETART